MIGYRWIHRPTQAGIPILIAFVCLVGGALAQKAPSDSASGAFRGEGGFSFRVGFAEGEIVFKRTVPDLPQNGRGMPAWLGEAYILFRAAPGPAAKKLSVGRNAWDHQLATYDVSGDRAKVVVSRLTPAVLIDTPASSVAFEDTGPTNIAFVSGGKVSAASTANIESSIKLDEPWVLGWFGRSSPYRNYPNVADLDDEHLGSDKVSLSRRRPLKLDLPLLFRLEHRPT
ncbi:hypothetical protein HQ563_16120, partial [bacterium]|nr:hypothetical protein [bacterium]